MGDRRRVLVVDDERNITQMMAMMLQTRGYEVDIASSGEEAIQKAIELANELNHQQIDTEHLTLALLKDTEGIKIAGSICILSDGVKYLVKPYSVDKCAST